MGWQLRAGCTGVSGGSSAAGSARRKRYRPPRQGKARGLSPRERPAAQQQWTPGCWDV